MLDRAIKLCRKKASTLESIIFPSKNQAFND